MFPTNREIWKTISEYAEYEVSNFGRVRNATTDRILNGAINAGGYLVVGYYIIWGVFCRKNTFINSKL